MTAIATTPQASPAPTPLGRRRDSWILAAMCTALVAVVASVSGLNVAQQQLAADLGASQTTLLWIINGYTITLAALLLPIGAIGDRIGRRSVLLAGLGVFALANLGAAFAGTATVMLVARLIAGVGAAMVMPATLSVITASFPAEDRAKAVGVWAGFAGAGGIIGLFFSSAMIDWVSWPWVFSLPVVLCAVAFAISVAVVPDSRDETNHPFDYAGSFLSAIGIAGTVLAIHEGPEHGWTAPLTLLGLIAGLAALAGFVLVERRREHPLLDVRLFSNRSLATGSLNLLVIFAVMFGLFLVLVQFLQAVLGYSALRASAGLLPMAVLMMPLSNVAPRVAERIGTRRTMMIGTGTIVLGLLAMAIFASADSGYLSIVPGLLLMAVGMGFTMTPSTIAITQALPVEQQGVASALNDTVRELGGALGVALLGTIVAHGYRSDLRSVSASLPDAVREPVERGIGGALAVAPKLGDQGATVLHAAREAFVHGWQQSMWVGAGLAAVAFVTVALVGRDPS